MATDYEVRATFKAKDLWSKRLGRMSAATRKFNGNLSGNLKRVKAFESEWRGATAPVRAFGRTAARTGAVVAIATGAALKSVVDEGAEFEQTMAAAIEKFGGMANVGADEFEKMKRVAMDVGETTEQSAAQAAGALKFMAMAGEKPAVAMGVIADAANFATAGQIELARATDVMSDAMGPLMGKVEGAEARMAAYKHTMDLMTHATTRGNMGIEEMFEATKMGAAGFRGAGQDIEQFTASVAVLSNAGIKGSKAGKDLQRMMISLTAPTNKAGKAMRDASFDPVNKDGTIKDFNVIMAEMKTVTDKMDEEGRSKFLAQVIGKNSMASALALMDNAAAIKTLATEAKDVMGITAKQAEGMRNTTAGMVKGMESAFSAMKLEVFEVVKDDVKEIVQDVTKWGKLHKKEIAGGVKDFIVFIRDNKDEIIFWGKTIVGITAAFVVLDTGIAAVRITMQLARGAQLAWTAASTVAGPVFSMLSGTIGKMGAQFMATRGSGAELFKIVNTMHGPLGKLGAVAGLAGAGFIGWEIGKLINEFTGADNAIAGLLIRMDGFIALSDKMNKRAATKTEDEFLDRQKSDLMALKKEMDAGALGGIIQFKESSPLGQEIARQEALIKRLEKKKKIRDMGGGETGDPAFKEAKERAAASRLAVQDMKMGVGHTLQGDEFKAALQGKLDEREQAETALDKFDTPEYKLAQDVQAASAGMTDVERRHLAAQDPAFMGVGSMGAVGAVTEDLSLATLEAIREAILLSIEEQRKANTTPTKVAVTVVAPSGSETGGQPSQGNVTTERTGAL